MVNATCAALYCLSSSNARKDLKFHQFPHDLERRKLWITVCKRSDVIDKDWDYFKHKHVCSLHFHKSMYTKTDRLRKTAVPSINLSIKPLLHDTFTQTWESMLNITTYQNIQENEVAGDNSQNDVSILYVQDIIKNMQTTSTQTDDSIPFDTHHVHVKEEIETPTKLSDLIEFEPDAVIKIENDEDVDSEEFEQDMEMKIEIVENEILPYLQSTKSVVPEKEIMIGGETLSTQAIDKIATIGNKTKRSVDTNTDTTSTEPKKRKVDGSVQTDRVMVFPIENKESIYLEDCTCDDDVVMARQQFKRCCSKFLSPTFCAIVRKQMYLDGLLRKLKTV